MIPPSPSNFPLRESKCTPANGISFIRFNNDLPIASYVRYKCATPPIRSHEIDTGDRRATRRMTLRNVRFRPRELGSMSLDRILRRRRKIFFWKYFDPRLCSVSSPLTCTTLSLSNQVLIDPKLGLTPLRVHEFKSAAYNHP